MKVYGNAWKTLINLAVVKGKSSVVAEATRGLLYQSRCVSKSATSVVWEVYAKLRLKDLTDYFEKVPLLKGSTMRFLINTNQAEVSITPTANTLPVAQASVLSGNTFPLMVTSQKATSATASGGVSSLDATVAVKLSVDIVKSRQSGHQTSLTSCRLYAPLYKFNPLAEQRYLSLAPTKRVEYEDVFQYQFTGVKRRRHLQFPRVQWYSGYSECIGCSFPFFVCE